MTLLRMKRTAATPATAIFIALMAFLALTARAFGQGDEAHPQVVEMALGSETAAVQVEEYLSFTCPHCARFHRDVYPQLKANYIDTGKIRFIAREVYFDRVALWAAMLARCGGPDRYFGIADLLFQRQDDWIRKSDPTEVANELFRIGRIAGMTEESMGQCLQDRDMALAMIEVSEAQRTAAGINSTPSLVVDGVNHRSVSYAELASLIDAALGD